MKKLFVCVIGLWLMVCLIGCGQKEGETGEGAVAESYPVDFLDTLDPQSTHLWYQATPAADALAVPAAQVQTDAADTCIQEAARYIRDAVWAAAEPPSPVEGPVVCYGTDREHCFMCFLDTATVAIIDGYDTNWYEVRSGAPSTTLPELMSVLFSLTECSFGNVTIPYAESEDSARVAQNYGAAVVEYMAQLTPDNACRPQDFQTVSVEVTDERWDETPVVLITYTYAVQVEPDKSHGCWIAGGGGTPGTGALEGYTICGSGIRLEAADGIWQCTGISTSLMSLDE